MTKSKMLQSSAVKNMEESSISKQTQLKNISTLQNSDVKLNKISKLAFTINTNPKKAEKFNETVTKNVGNFVPGKKENEDIKKQEILLEKCYENGVPKNLNQLQNDDITKAIKIVEMEIPPNDYINKNVNEITLAENLKKQQKSSSADKKENLNNGKLLNKMIINEKDEIYKNSKNSQISNSKNLLQKGSKGSEDKQITPSIGEAFSKSKILNEEHELAKMKKSDTKYLNEIGDLSFRLVKKHLNKLDLEYDKRIYLKAIFPNLKIPKDLGVGDSFGELA